MQRQKWRDLTDIVIHCIAKDGLLAHAVEKPSFKRFLNVMDSRYEVPSQSNFSRTPQPILCAAMKDTIKEKLSKVEYSATTDLWSIVLLINYTIYFIDSTWKYRR